MLMLLLRWDSWSIHHLLSVMSFGDDGLAITLYATGPATVRFTTAVVWQTIGYLPRLITNYTGDGGLIFLVVALLLVVIYYRLRYQDARSYAAPRGDRCRC